MGKKDISSIDVNTSVTLSTHTSGDTLEVTVEQVTVTLTNEGDEAVTVGTLTLEPGVPTGVAPSFWSGNQVAISMAGLKAEPIAG